MKIQRAVTLKFIGMSKYLTFPSKGVKPGTDAFATA